MRKKKKKVEETLIAKQKEYFLSSQGNRSKHDMIGETALNRHDWLRFKMMDACELKDYGAPTYLCAVECRVELGKCLLFVLAHCRHSKEEAERKN